MIADGGIALDVRTCRGCRRLFNYLTGPLLCPACKEKLEEKFQEVKQYIEEHKGVNMHEVADACDVEVSQIRQWLKEERLEIVEGSGIFLTCESCGAPINTGRFCAKCRNAMTNDFQSLLKKSKPDIPVEKPNRENGRMRYL